MGTKFAQQSGNLFNKPSFMLHADRAGIDVAKDAAHREQPHASDLSLVPEAPGDDLTVGRKLV